MSTDTTRLYARPVGAADPKVARGVWTKVNGVLKPANDVLTNRLGSIVSVWPVRAKAPSNVQRTSFTKNTTPGMGRTYPWTTTVTWDQPASDNPVIGYTHSLGLVAEPGEASTVQLPLSPRSDAILVGRMDQLTGSLYVYGVRARAADGLHSTYTEITFTTPPYPVPTGVISSLDVELFAGAPTLIWTAGADGEFVNDYLVRYKVGAGSYSGYMSMGFNDAYGAGFKNFALPGVVLPNGSSVTIEITAVGPAGSDTPSTITFNTPRTPTVNQNRYYLGYMRIGISTTDPDPQGYSFQSYHEAWGWSQLVHTGNVTLYDHGPSGSYPRNFYAAYMKIYPFNSKGSGQPITTGWIRKIPNPIYFNATETDTAVFGIGGYSHWGSAENPLSGFNIHMGWTSVGYKAGMGFYGGGLKSQYASSYLGYTFSSTACYVFLWRQNAYGLEDGTNNAGSPAYNPSWSPGMLPYLYLHPYPAKGNVDIMNPTAGWAGGPYVIEGNRLLMNEGQLCALPVSWGDELIRGAYYGIGVFDAESNPNRAAYDPPYYVSYRWFVMRSSYDAPAWQLRIDHDA